MEPVRERTTTSVVSPERRVAAGPSPQRARSALNSASTYLLGLQKEDGHWCAELEGDSILLSEYILLLHFQERSGEARAKKLAERLRRTQLESGGWAIFHGGGADVSTSVKGYFALKLMGDSPTAPHMVKARETVRSLGGLDATNSFTKIYLAVFGQYSWDRCPAVPPEMILVPRWFSFNIYAMSSWSRAIVVPLSLIWARKPSCPVPQSASLSELHVEGATAPLPSAVLKENPWTRFFRFVNAALKVMERLHLRPLRRRAIRRSEAWIHQRLEKSGGLGAIFPSIVNTIIAFRSLGYAKDDPVVKRQELELEKLEIETEDTLRVQPCFSPVWDTSLSINALVDAGLDETDPRLLRASQWLLDHEVKSVGDWQVNQSEVGPGGWYFEYANEFYPDCDDTAEVLTSLKKLRYVGGREERRAREAMDRGLAWLLAMQNRDGGWAAFDKGCDKEYLTQVPFADHNAMIDPSCEDITGRVLETLALFDHGVESPVVQDAIAFLFGRQEEDGSWYGRWGCNYLYGTWLVLWGLRCIGFDMSRDRTRLAASWMVGVQNSDGGWGETPESYADPEQKGRGPSTASQTSWAILGLLAAGGHEPAVRRGVDWLLARQQADGTWEEDAWTGTGFPQVFYLRYHLYATHFPIMALAAWERASSSS